MRRDFYRYLIAFLLCSGLALWVSMPTKDKGIAGETILALKPHEIGVISYDSPEVKVEAKRVADKWWIETDKAGVKDRFMASSKMAEFLSTLDPLYAVRAIGKVKEDALEEYGLKDSKRVIAISDVKSTALLKLTIGKQAYGTRNVFVHESKEDRVVLLPGEFVADLERPDLKLYERLMTNLVFDELKKAEVSQDAKGIKLSHSKRDDKGALLWTKEGDDASVVVSAKSWMERLDKVRVVSFVSSELAQQLDSEARLFVVLLEAQDGSKDKLEFVKKQTIDDAKKQLVEYYVKSGFLGVWAKVGSTRLEPIEKDLPTLLGH
jgi:hypothetical protein